MTARNSSWNAHQCSMPQQAHNRQAETGSARTSTERLVPLRCHFLATCTAVSLGQTGPGAPAGCSGRYRRHGTEKGGGGLLSGPDAPHCRPRRASTCALNTASISSRSSSSPAPSLSSPARRRAGCCCCRCPPPRGCCCCRCCCAAAAAGAAPAACPPLPAGASLPCENMPKSTTSKLPAGVTHRASALMPSTRMSTCCHPACTGRQAQPYDCHQCPAARLPWPACHSPISTAKHPGCL